MNKTVKRNEKIKILNFTFSEPSEKRNFQIKIVEIGKKYRTWYIPWLQKVSNAVNKQSIKLKFSLSVILYLCKSDIIKRKILPMIITVKMACHTSLSNGWM